MSYGYFPLKKDFIDFSKRNSSGVNKDVKQFMVDVKRSIVEKRTNLDFFAV